MYLDCFVIDDLVRHFPVLHFRRPERGTSWLVADALVFSVDTKESVNQSINQSNYSQYQHALMRVIAKNITLMSISLSPSGIHN